MARECLVYIVHKIVVVLTISLRYKMECVGRDKIEFNYIMFALWFCLRLLFLSYVIQSCSSCDAFKIELEGLYAIPARLINLNHLSLDGFCVSLSLLCNTKL
jgi:hypothetical protein